MLPASQEKLLSPVCASEFRQVHVSAKRAHSARRAATGGIDVASVSRRSASDTFPRQVHTPRTPHKTAVALIMLSFLAVSAGEHLQHQHALQAIHHGLGSSSCRMSTHLEHHPNSSIVLQTARSSQKKCTAVLTLCFIEPLCFLHVLWSTSPRAEGLLRQPTQPTVAAAVIQAVSTSVSRGVKRNSRPVKRRMYHGSQYDATEVLPSGCGARRPDVAHRRIGAGALHASHRAGANQANLWCRDQRGDRQGPGRCVRRLGRREIDCRSWAVCEVLRVVRPGRQAGSSLSL